MLKGSSRVKRCMLSENTTGRPRRALPICLAKTCSVPVLVPGVVPFWFRIRFRFGFFPFGSSWLFVSRLVPVLDSFFDFVFDCDSDFGIDFDLLVPVGFLLRFRIRFRAPGLCFGHLAFFTTKRNRLLCDDSYPFGVLQFVWSPFGFR